MRRLPDPARAARGRPAALAGLVRAGGADRQPLAITLAIVPLLPLVLLVGISDTLGAIALLVLVLLQDGVFVGAAVLFAAFTRPPRPWHFGVRTTPLWPTVGWTVLGFALMLGFELGQIELFDVDETNVEDLGELSSLAGIAVALVVVAARAGGRGALLPRVLLPRAAHEAAHLVRRD